MRFGFNIGLMILLGVGLNLQAADPVRSPAKTVAMPVASMITIHSDQPKQPITGIGFEIQCDSIGSDNHGLSGKIISPKLPLGILGGTMNA